MSNDATKDIQNEFHGRGSAGGRGGKKTPKKGRIRTPKHRYGDTEGRPLGVGPDYLADTQGPNKIGYQGGGGKGRGSRITSEPGDKERTKPRYYSGASTEILGTMDSDTIHDVQVALWRLGFLDDKYVTYAFNKNTGEAFNQVLASANAEGVGWKKWLGAKMAWLDENNIDTLGGAGSEGDSVRALQINLSNPDTIKAAVTQQSTDLLGGNYAGDPQQYVDEVHAQETKQQTDAYNQTGGPEGSTAPEGGGGGTTFDPATVEALIMKKHPTDYSVEQSGRNAQAVLDSLLTRHTPDSRG